MQHSSGIGHGDVGTAARVSGVGVSGEERERQRRVEAQPWGGGPWGPSLYSHLAMAL